MQDGVEHPAIAALGKFDALHRGHRALAAHAAAMGGQPWLITFSGMAEVLGMSFITLNIESYNPGAPSMALGLSDRLAEASHSHNTHDMIRNVTAVLHYVSCAHSPNPKSALKYP